MNSPLLGLLQGVTKRCHLSWRPIAPLHMSPNAWGGGGLRGLSQGVQLYTGAQINLYLDSRPCPTQRPRTPVLASSPLVRSCAKTICSTRTPSSSHMMKQCLYTWPSTVTRRPRCSIPDSVGRCIFGPQLPPPCTEDMALELRRDVKYYCRKKRRNLFCSIPTSCGKSIVLR